MHWTHDTDTTSRQTDGSCTTKVGPRPHMLRVLDGAVLDSPVPLLHPDARCWVATCWPDSAAPGGWARVLWWTSPYHRGLLPVALSYADVVEFAADVPVRRRWRTHWRPVRWYGLVLQESEREMLVYGPYDSAADALLVSDELRGTLAYHRLSSDR